jgi:NAD(P)-dependent dehydrogenase (short-subunit alcohol dehydrogenase family)
MSSNPSEIYLVVGGSGGIGFEVAKRLRSLGVEVVLAAREKERLDDCAQEIGARAATMDATESASVTQALEQTLSEGDRLVGVAHCVGTILLKPAHLTSDEDWRTTLETNLTSSFLILRETARRMMQGGGAMVFCSTVAAQRGLFNHEAIAAAKAGVEGLARAAASTYARYKIRVNCVAPGLVETPLSQSITNNEAARKVSLALHPLGRLGEPGDVASAICWLLSPEQSWVTGQVLGVDGGMSTVQPR